MKRVIETTDKTYKPLTILIKTKERNENHQC